MRVSLNLLAILSLSLVVQTSFADVVINEGALEQNLSYVAWILQDVAVISGIALILSAVFKFKRLGEARSMMMHQRAAGPLMTMLAGIILLYAPTFLDTALLAFWGTVSPEAAPNASWSAGLHLNAIIVFVRVLGIFSFIKGVWKLSQAGREQSPPGTVGKALISIFVGVLLVHIVALSHLIQQIFGVQST